jgi:predicted aconitase
MGHPASDPCRNPISGPRISCRCRRLTSWLIPNRSVSPASSGWKGLLALPEAQRHVRIPTITDPRGTDFTAAARLNQQDWMLALERRAIAAFQAFGVLMTDTCINYQTIMPAVRGEHMAYGDTGVVIYSNSVLGAR